MGPAPPHDRSHPPIDFPFFGVSPWKGPTWVEFYEGAIGHPMTTLWLGHRVENGRAHISVGTNTQRLDGLELSEDLAFGALFTLSERMRPARTAVELPAGFNKAQVDHVYESSQRWREWPTVGCEVDGAEAVLSHRRYAWGWAGFISDVGVAGVKLVAVDVEPDTIALRTIRTPQTYGFDPSQRLSVSDLDERAELAGDARLPLPWTDTVHPDQQALIDHHGLS
ncbi:hypothetical protein AD006_30115 (plasmid) [Pseudonocardia sp. EC080610-09]|uniref:hypothetical protein n=1 Tax=unclassified Pseudonocardia TaxID=2619320 RepID=UPI000706712F|nr:MULTISPECIES: hypothetical protein [unclassified Pseudonocardia]ALL79497.1 hypothetical protein AD006_30115 [Pseudonocardia sp. EC080610-09]ALL85550.1 hypothetical protein AD017_31135 [Pseudonocardia sp. EC080619-01]